MRWGAYPPTKLLQTPIWLNLVRETIFFYNVDVTTKIAQSSVVTNRQWIVKARVFYFSSTGNTRLGAELVARGICQGGGCCDLVDITDSGAEKVALTFNDVDLVGFACPTFVWKPPIKVTDFIHNLPELEGRLGFLFCTCGWEPEGVVAKLASEVVKKKIILIDSYIMWAEESMTMIRWRRFILNRGRPNAEDRDGAIRFGENLVHKYKQYKDDPSLPPHRSKRKFSCLTPISILGCLARQNLIKYYFRKKVNLELCNQCGLCAQQCPVGAIKMADYPKFCDNCIMCFRCINLCPQDAIESWFTKGNPRYKGPKI